MNAGDLAFTPRQSIDGGVVVAPASRPDLRFAHVATVGATNALAMAALERGVADAVAIVADMQTAGRGRRGSAWSAPAGESLLLSVGFRTALAAAARPSNNDSDVCCWYSAATLTTISAALETK